MRAIWIILAMASVAVARHHHKTYVMKPAEAEQMIETNRNLRQINEKTVNGTTTPAPVATCGCRGRRAIESTENIETCQCPHKRHRRSVDSPKHHVYKTEYIVEEEHVRKQDPDVYTSHVFKRRVSGEMNSQETIPIVKDDMRQVRDTVGFVYDDGINKPIAEVNVRTERFERKLEEDGTEQQPLVQ